MWDVLRTILFRVFVVKVALPGAINGFAQHWLWTEVAFAHAFVCSEVSQFPSSSSFARSALCGQGSVIAFLVISAQHVVGAQLIIVE